MKPNISEFSYGYALTDELINWHGTNVTAAPVFPSLYQEGQTGGGYDVMLNRGGVPLFLQFKLADLMKKGNAKEAKKGLLVCPYYKMHLRPRTHSDQHQLLIDLESSGNEVYYVAPSFHEPNGLNDAYLNHEVKDKSIWVKPSLIGPLPDDKDHYVAFQTGSNSYFCSEPRRIDEPTTFQNVSRRIEEKLNTRNEDVLNQDQMSSLADTLYSISQNRKGILQEQSLVARQTLRQRNPLEEVAYYAQAYFNCQLFIVRER